MSIYSDMVEAGIPTDSHESDLYVRATKEAYAILRRHKNTTHRWFINQLDGHAWIDVPFAFDPFWKRRQLRGTADVSKRS